MEFFLHKWQNPDTKRKSSVRVVLSAATSSVCQGNNCSPRNLIFLRRGFPENWVEDGPWTWIIRCDYSAAFITIPGESCGSSLLNARSPISSVHPAFALIPAHPLFVFTVPTSVQAPFSIVASQLVIYTFIAYQSQHLIYFILFNLHNRLLGGYHYLCFEGIWSSEGLSHSLRRPRPAFRPPPTLSCPSHWFFPYSKMLLNYFQIFPI